MNLCTDCRFFFLEVIFSVTSLFCGLHWNLVTLCYFHLHVPVAQRIDTVRIWIYSAVSLHLVCRRMLLWNPGRIRVIVKDSDRENLLKTRCMFAENCSI